MNLLNTRKKKINHRDQGKEKTYRHSQIHLRQDKTQLRVMPDRDLSFCERKIRQPSQNHSSRLAASSRNTVGATDLLLKLCEFFLLLLFPADPLLFSLSLLFFISQPLFLLLLPQLLLPSCFFLSCSPGHFFFSDSRVSKVHITGYLFL